MKRTSKSGLWGYATVLLGACHSSAVGQPPAEETPQNDAIWPAPGASPSDTASDDKNNPWLMDLVGGATNTLPPTTTQTEQEALDDPPFDAGDASSSSGGASGGSKTPAEDEASGALPPAAPSDAEREPQNWVAPSVLFRRYREGEGADKLLEVQNLGEVDAVSCAITIYSNGNAKPWRTLELPATLPPQASVVLCTDKVADQDCTDPMSGAPFNGNDALVLTCAARVVDSIGQVGFDPGLGWLSASRPELRTYDAELVRCGIAADTDPGNEFVLESQWAPVPAGGSLQQVEDICSEHNPGLGGAPG